MSTIHLAAGSVCPPLKPGVLRCYNMKYCPYAQRTLLVLAAKKVKHDIVNINLRSKPEWYFTKNPLGKVPALELENGEVIYESLVTCDYLDQVLPEPRLNPADPLKMARDRMLLEVWSSKVIPLHLSCWKSQEEDAARCLKDMYNGLDFFEAELAKRRTVFYCGDNEPGMLDYMIWPWCERIPAVQMFAGDNTPILEERFPKMWSWMGKMREDPAVLATLISTNTHHKFFLSYKNAIPDPDMEEIP